MLANVDALGHAVPTARFMGGREYEAILGPGDAPVVPTHDALASILQSSGFRAATRVRGIGAVRVCGAPDPHRRSQTGRARGTRDRLPRIEDRPAIERSRRDGRHTWSMAR